MSDSGHKSDVGQELMRELKLCHGPKQGTSMKITPSKGRGGSSAGQSASGLGGLENMLNLTSDARGQRFKIQEMRMKARLVKLGGGTDEQRQHELELARLNIKKEELTLQLKKEELNAAHELRMKELEIRKVELEIKSKHCLEGRSRSRSYSQPQYSESGSQSLSRSPMARSKRRSSRTPWHSRPKAKESIHWRSRKIAAKKEENDFPEESQLSQSSTSPPTHSNPSDC